MMVEIENNFSSGTNKTPCFCGDEETMSHIYDCDILSENNKSEIPYEKINNGNMKQQIEVYKQF